MTVSQQDFDDLSNKMAALRRELDEMNERMSGHVGLDWGASGTNYPHPNQQISTAEFGGGVMRLDEQGIQLDAPDLGADFRRLVWVVPVLDQNPSTQYPRAEHYAWYQGSPAEFEWTSVARQSATENVFSRQKVSSAEVLNELGAVLGGSTAAYVQVYAASGGLQTVTVNPSLNLADVTADPASFSDGMLWYRSDTDLFRVRRNGATENLITSGATDWVDLTDGGESTLHTHASAGGSMKISGFPFPFDPAEIASPVSDVTISGNTTYNTQANRVLFANNFTIDGAVTLTAKEGLFLVCNTFTINNASGMLDARGAAGTNASGVTNGTGGAKSTSVGTAGGDGGAGKSSGSGSNPGIDGGNLSATTDVPDLNSLAQSVELAQLRAAFYSGSADTFDVAVWGLGGRGGGGGGGGGASAAVGGGLGGAGGTATGYANTNNSAAGAAGAIAGAGGSATAATAVALPGGFMQAFGMAVPMWYYGAGSGGGGGGGGGRNATQTSGAGGGGGGGGNVVIIICDTFNNLGTITVAGGAGGNGSAGSGSAVGDGGGGGGGGGGTVLIICRTYIADNSTTAAGGAKGTGATSGAGPNGGDGADGSTGSYHVIRAA